MSLSHSVICYCCMALLPFLLNRALLDCVIDRKVPDITSEAILSPSESYQNITIQDNPENFCREYAAYLVAFQKVPY